MSLLIKGNKVVDFRGVEYEKMKSALQATTLRRGLFSQLFSLKWKFIYPKDNR